MKIFFVSDIHGSVRCFRKLVNAGKFYGVDLLIMGGDLAGKQLVPIIVRGGTSSGRYQGAEFTFETDAEIAEFERRIGDRGGYALMRWWAPDGILEDVTMARAFHGHEEIRPYLEMYFRALPQITYEPIRLVISGPTAVVEWAQSTVVAEPFDGTPSVGTEIFLRAVDMFHVADGLVQHEVGWYGDGWLRQRLGESGTVPPPPLPVTPPLARRGARFQ
jgi:hypothetical protein